MIQTMVDRLREHRFERYFVPVLVLFALAAFVISLAIGLSQSVWFDEAYSVLLAKQPINNLVHLASVDMHPPFYYLLLKVWAGVFGWSEMSLRSLSAIMMSCAIVTGGLLARRVFGVRAALMSLPFIALSPLLLRYGFEIRSYALASFIGIAATYTLVAALEAKSQLKQWRLYMLYALLVALGVYTLYYTAFLWVAHFVWLMYRALRDRRPVVKAPWFMALLGSVLLFLPWLPVLVVQANSGAFASVLQPVNVDSLAGMVSFAFLYKPAWQLGGIGTVMLVFIMLTLGTLGVRTFRVAAKKERDYLLLFAAYLLVPVVLLTALSLVRPMYIERYISHLLIGVMLLGGVVAVRGTHKASLWLRSAMAGVYVVLLLGVGQLAYMGNYNFQRLQRPVVKEIASSIRSCNKNDTILAADPYVAIELSYYLSQCELRFYSSTDELGGTYAPLSVSPLRIARPETQLANSPRLQYVYYGTPHLTMPPNLVKTAHDIYGTLSIDTFIVR